MTIAPRRDGLSPCMPSPLHLVRLDDVAPTRWRNDGGWTRELIAWPQADPWTVRVSVADIERDGPFSVYAGVERWFAVLAGNGVELSHDAGVSSTLRPGNAVHRFAGESVTTCRLLDGSTRDFNLMLRRARATATVTPLPDGLAAISDWAGCFAATPVRVRLADDPDWQVLPPFALAWTTRPARLLVDAPVDARGWRLDVLLEEEARR